MLRVLRQREHTRLGVYLPCFALNGLQQERSDVLPIVIQRTPEILNVTITNRLNTPILILVRRTNAREVRSKPTTALRISAHAVPETVQE